MSTFFGLFDQYKKFFLDYMKKKKEVSTSICVGCKVENFVESCE
jgi:hypothetical protein